MDGISDCSEIIYSFIFCKCTTSINQVCHDVTDKEKYSLKCLKTIETAVSFLFNKPLLY